jgi:GcrA cell cycle regulator
MAMAAAAANALAPERVARVFALLAKGLTYAHAAAEVGVSKGAIAGLLHRRGGPSSLELLDKRLGWERVRQRGCAWVIGDPRSPDWTWCGGVPVAGSSYCIRHQRIARFGSRNVFAGPAAAGEVLAENSPAQLPLSRNAAFIRDSRSE